MRPIMLPIVGHGGDAAPGAVVKTLLRHSSHPLNACAGGIFVMRDSYEDSPEAARESGLRRLRRLTWRTTQLGALATVGFAIVFARTAPAPAASVQQVLPTQPPTTIATPSHAVGQHSAKPRSTASTHPATQPAVQPATQQATRG